MDLSLTFPSYELYLVSVVLLYGVIHHLSSNFTTFSFNFTFFLNTSLSNASLPHFHSLEQKVVAVHVGITQ